MSDKQRILIIHDEPDIGDFISNVAIESGFDAVAIQNSITTIRSETYKYN